ADEASLPSRATSAAAVMYLSVAAGKEGPTAPGGGAVGAPYGRQVRAYSSWSGPAGDALKTAARHPAPSRVLVVERTELVVLLRLQLQAARAVHTRIPF